MRVLRCGDRTDDNVDIGDVAFVEHDLSATSGQVAAQLALRARGIGVNASEEVLSTNAT